MKEYLRAFGRKENGRRKFVPHTIETFEKCSRRILGQKRKKILAEMSKKAEFSTLV